MRLHRVRVLTVAVVLTSAAALAAGCTSSSTKPPPGKVLVPPITFIYPNQSWDTVRTEIGQLLTKEWQQLGLQVDAVPADFDTAAARLDSKPKSYGAYIYAFSSNPEVIDPDAILRQGFACPTNGSGGANYVHYCNSAFDTLLNKSAGEPDQAVRKQDVAQLETMMYNDVPAVPLYHLETLSAYNSAKFSAPVPFRAEGAWYWWPGQAVPKTSDTTLKIGQTFDLGSANPFVSTDGGNAEYLKLLYDTLTRVTPEGKTVPWAAQSYTYSDPTTLQVTLRSGMKFTDGTPVTADDVKFSYELFAKGSGGAADFAPYLAKIASIDVDSPTSLTFHMKEAYAPFATVAMSQIYILPEHIWKSHTDDLETFSNVPLVGSGQFSWDYWKKNQEVALKANPAHYAAPKISELIGVTFGTADAVYQALAKQQIDIEQASLLPNQFDSLKSESFMTATTSDDIGVYYMGFNLDVAPFNNQKFRQAMSYTVPYPTIVNTILGGYGKAGDAFIAPANTVWHVSGQPTFSFDLAKATQLLKAAGYTLKDGKLYMPAPKK